MSASKKASFDSDFLYCELYGLFNGIDVAVEIIYFLIMSFEGTKISST